MKEQIIKNEKFDQKTILALGNYVYMLMSSEDNRPFYIGKGKGNRVFDHIEEAINSNKTTDKCDMIREIINSGATVKHVILWHGLETEKEALLLESVLIDTLNYLGHNLTNAVVGHHANEKGVMTTDEIKRMYDALPLDTMGADCVIININGRYNRSMGSDAIYEATKEIWRMNPKRNGKMIKYVLSEYRGLIIDVFEVDEWYKKERQYTSGKKKGQKYNGWGFNGHKASQDIRELYINKSIAHKKKQGQANPITYTIKNDDMPL